MMENRVAYFSMEIALESKIPTYSGGLGVLAGDTIRSAADVGLPLVAVTLLHRKGYFTQRLDPNGWQREEPVIWSPDQFLEKRSEQVSVSIEGRSVRIGAWEYQVTGVTGRTVDVYLLDSDLEENSPWDRTLTHYLYGGDQHYRLCQEVILGIGGVRMLRALGLENIDRFHMNEGHSSLLALELLDERVRAAGRTRVRPEDIGPVRRQCVFTTHTPVPAGHDRFPLDLVAKVLGRAEIEEMQDVFCCEGVLNMTFLALNLSHYVNGVAKKHGEVSQHMFSEYRIDAITNGIHAATWVCEAFAKLLDRHIPDWKKDNFSLRYALSIPPDEVWQAHLAAKSELLRLIKERSGQDFDPAAFTLGFARRATSYKRMDLLLTDPGRLRSIVSQVGPLQIVCAGKAHPQDQEGKQIIQHIVQAGRKLPDSLRLVYLENYDLEMARLLTSGSDLWLNTPRPPLEASGTSGMKAAANAVPSLSVLDGWWIEGCIEGVTGWAVGDASNIEQHSEILYAKLREVMTLFYRQRERYLSVMQHSVALNGAFFNTQRMVQQYVLKAYFE